MRFKKGYLLIIIPAIALIGFTIYNLSTGMGIGETISKSFQATFITFSIVWALGLVSAMLSIPLTRIFNLQHLTENERFVFSIIIVLLITSLIFNYSQYWDSHSKSNDIIRLNSQLDTERKNNRELEKKLSSQNTYTPKLNLPPPSTSTYKYSPPKLKEKKQIGSYRIGAECWDGTYSSATGRGACSWHGGVKRWIYNTDKK